MRSVYIHIPFCKNICSYCDFTKFFYQKKWIIKYLDALKEEIRLNYCDDPIKTIYIGGGTPSSLDIQELEYLFEIINVFDKSKLEEFTIEVNPDSLDIEKIKLFKKYGINRISMGVQTFDQKHLKNLNRTHTISDIKKAIEIIKKHDINNISVDLIYGLPNQTMEELDSDLDSIIMLDIPHVSTYSLLIEPNTLFYIKKIQNIDEDIDNEMYELIKRRLNNYNHYEISNFGLDGYSSKHNQIYWNNLEYYGFGVGASGYIKNRYINSKSLNKYLSQEFEKEIENITYRDKIIYEVILGLRMLKGINLNDFHLKYQKSFEELFDVKELLDNKELIIKDNYLFLNPEYIYISNRILTKIIEKTLI